MGLKCKRWRDGSPRRHINHPMKTVGVSVRHGPFLRTPEKPKVALRLYRAYNEPAWIKARARAAQDQSID